MGVSVLSKARRLEELEGARMRARDGEARGPCRRVCPQPCPSPCPRSKPTKRTCAGPAGRADEAEVDVAEAAGSSRNRRGRRVAVARARRARRRARARLERAHRAGCQRTHTPTPHDIFNARQPGNHVRAGQGPVPEQGPPKGPVKPAEHWHAVNATAPVATVVLLATQTEHATLAVVLLYVPSGQIAQLLASAPP